MMYKGIIITGCSASGKSTVANILNSLDDFKIKLVKAVTTRQKRSDDKEGQYEYISKAEFESLKRNNMLFVNTKYRNENYGIKISELKSMVNAGKIPLLVLSPEACYSLKDTFNEYLSFFFDNSDDVLDQRLKEREDFTDSVKIKKQRDIDRQYSNICMYTIKSNIAESTAKNIIHICKKEMF